MTIVARTIDEGTWDECVISLDYDPKDATWTFVHGGLHGFERTCDDRQDAIWWFDLFGRNR